MRDYGTYCDVCDYDFAKGDVKHDTLHKYPVCSKCFPKQQLIGAAGFVFSVVFPMGVIFGLSRLGLFGG